MVKTTGQAQERIAKGKILSHESGLPVDIKWVSETDQVKASIETQCSTREFSGQPAISNIMTAPDDMSVPLSAKKIEAALASYRTFIQEKLRNENPDWSEELLEQEVKKKTRRPPERVYREALDETEGVLIIYLFDTNYVFNPKGNSDDDAYQDYVESNKLNLDTPLVGFALGFPPIKGDSGGNYLVRDDYELEAEEEHEDDDLPSDASEEGLT